jgi:Putative auto-transporter adhesin, head GIN domain
MIRALVMIAVAGFLLCIGSLAIAVSVGGPDLLARGAWAFGPSVMNGDWANDWDWDSSDHHHGRLARVTGPTVTRDFTWPGGDTLVTDVPVDMRYTQAPGPAKLTITGPQDALDLVRIENGHIRFERPVRRFGRLTVVMTAPDVTRFDLNGRDRLTIENYRHDQLNLEISGGAEATVVGETKTLTLDVSGGGDAMLDGLKTEGARVDVSGSGDATLAPTDWAEIEVSGAGDVTLTTRPGRLETDVSGSGEVHQGGDAPPTPSTKGV